MPQKTAYDGEEPTTFPIRVHTNKDSFASKRIYVQTKKVKTFDHLLDEFTEKINPPFGAVRSIYTSHGRHKITRIEEFQRDGIYVATGVERFQKQDYNQIPDRLRAHHKGYNKTNKRYPPVNHTPIEKYRNKSAKYYYLNEHTRGLLISVHTNGSDTEGAVPILIQSKLRNDFSRIKDLIADAMACKTVARLFEITNCGGHIENFTEIHDPSEIRQNAHILAVPAGKSLVVKNYLLKGKPQFKIPTSPRVGQFYQFESFPEPKQQYRHNRSLYKHDRPLPSITNSSKQSDAVSPFSNPPSHHGRGGRRSKGRAQNVDYDKDDAGIYRAKGQNNARGAQQERHSADQGIRRIDEFDDESFGADDHYGGNSSLNKSVTNNPRESTPQSRTESRRKQRENKAVTKIQAGAKGSLARKTQKQKAEAEKRMRDDEYARHEEDELRRRQDEAASKIQAGYKGYMYRKDMNAKKAQVSEQDTVEVDRNENSSASKLKAGYEGYKERKDFNTRKTFSKKGEPEKEFEQEDEMSKNRETEAATKIQAGYRGYKVRKNNTLKQEKESVKDNKKEAEEKAAIKIQAGYRGYKTRKVCASRREAKQVVDDLMTNDDIYTDRHQNAARKIQAGYRGHITRKQYASQKSTRLQEDTKREAAATKIQAGYRGHQTRKRVAEQKKAKTELHDDAKEAAAASKIQAGYRGYKTRKDLKAKVMDGYTGRDDLEAEKLPDASLSFTKLSSNICSSAGSNKDSVSKLQNAFRGCITRKAYEHRLVKANVAMKIQAAYKGYRIRLVKRFAGASVQFDEFKKYKAAMKIHSIFNGYMERQCNARNSQKNYFGTKSEHVSKSSWIQNSEVETMLRHTPQGPSLHGFEKSYWEVSHIKMYSDEDRNEAVTKLQSAYFSFHTRKKYYAWKARQSKKSYAAKRIQSHFKGYLVRREKLNIIKYPEEKDEFAKVEEPKSAVAIYGRNADSSDFHLSSNNVDRKPQKDLSDKDSCFTENNSVSEIYQREKSLGYETIISVSGEVEKEGDSIKEIEDEAGELRVIEKHVSAIACLQAAVRAYKIRKEFQELLTGGGELLDIAKVDRAVSALRKEFKYKSAKVRRLAVNQFDSSCRERNWWEVDSSDDTALNTQSVNFETLSYSKKDNRVENQEVCTSINETPGFSEQQINNTRVVRDRASEENRTTLLQAAFKGCITRNQVLNKLSGNDMQTKSWVFAPGKRIKETVQNKTRNYIQIAFKGFLYRKHLSAKKQAESVTVIQCASKGFLQRKHLSEKTRLFKAAGKISAAFQGFIVRKHSDFTVNQKNSSKAARLQDECMSEKERFNKMFLQKHETAIIQSAAKGYLKRARCKGMKRSESNKKTYQKIQAAFSGYLARQKIKAYSPITAETEVAYNDEDDHNMMQASVTRLQATFAAYLTRKVFLSLAKIMADGDVADVSNYKLQRMGSLSETDDFKLKHKSIAKIQTALEEHRQRSLAGIAVGVNGNHSSTSESRTFLRYKKHSNHSQHSSITSTSNQSFAKVVDHKKPPEVPNTIPVKKGNASKAVESSEAKVSRIEKYIKLNIAASMVQASVRGYISRKTLKQRKRSKAIKRKYTLSPKNGPAAIKQNDRLTVKYESKTEKDMIRSRTASVKQEAERRKEIKTRVAAKENTHAVKSKAEKIKAEKETNLKSKQGPGIAVRSKKVDVVIQDDHTSANIKDTPSENESDVKKHGKISAGNLKSRFDPGITVQPKRVDVITLDEQTTGSEETLSETVLNNKTQERNFDREYEIWKQERISAAVMIQAGWRGYQARKAMLKQERNLCENYKDVGRPQKLIVINIGRSKSEIARSEQRYNNGSAIQMVYRTCKIRRKFKIKMAVKRHERNQAITKLQAFYRSYATRKITVERNVASRIQAVFKADRARYLNHTRKLLQKQNATSRIQAAWRSFKRRSLNETEKQIRKQQVEMNCASLAIQTAYKGFRERQKLLQKKMEIQKQASSRIQASLKGFLYRMEMKQKYLAATRIRCVCKSYSTRMRISLFKENQIARKNSATEIAYAFKAHLKRIEVLRFKAKMTAENTAAQFIHCSFRGMLARKHEKIRKELERLQNYSALKIQSFYRGCLGRKMARVLKNEKIRRELAYKQQFAAAIKIQSVYRGHIGRKAAIFEKYKKELHETSTEIIEVLLERTFSHLEQKSVAALQLLWSVRAHLTRTKIEFEKEIRRQEAVQRKKKMDAVATVIQTSFKAKQRRIHVAKAYRLREEHKAAMKIQALYRGYSTRQNLEREKLSLTKLSPLIISPDPDEVLKNARAIIEFHKNTTLLQGAFRAYSVRNKVNERFCRKISIIAITPRRQNSSKLLSYEDRAAIVIQKIFRGFSDRSMYGKLLKEKRKQETKASNIIKVSVNGYMNRRKQRILQDKIAREGSPEVRKQKYVAASMIAAAFRGYQKRKTNVSLRVEM